VDEARNDQLYELEVALRQLPTPDLRFGTATGGEQEPHAGYGVPWLVDRVLRNFLIDSTGNTHRAEICVDKLYSPDSSTGRLGLVEFRGFEMPPHARMSLAQQLVLRALIAWFWRRPYRGDLLRFGTSLHDKFMLPHFIWEDFEEVLSDLTDAGFAFSPEWFLPHFEFRFPLCGATSYAGVELELRTALEPWHVLGEEPSGGGTSRYVDSSLERLQLMVRGLHGHRYVVACNGIQVPLRRAGENDRHVAGIRFRAWQPPSCLHPLIGVQAPLTFDLVDTWNGRSIGGCTYHVKHPGGRGFENLPINDNEAEGRRLARFQTSGHSPGELEMRQAKSHPDFPYTLDLRRWE